MPFVVFLLLLVVLPIAGASSPAVAARAFPSDGPLLAAARTFTDSLTAYYAARDLDGLRSLHARARTLEQRLLVRYRLFPVTRDEGLLRDLPADGDARTARELALLSALWAYRASTAPAWRMPTFGRRSEALLTRARALDAADPYVLLVEGQALLYKPRMVGGNPREALARFQALRPIALRNPASGVLHWEADVWAWMAMRRLDHPDADATKSRLLAEDPPPLFRAFLLHPPD